jgi:arginine/ornithine transport system permease protein
MDWQIIIESLPLYAAGLRTTLVLLAISLASSFVLAVPLAIARVSPNFWISKPVWFFTYVLRGTPLLVQLFQYFVPVYLALKANHQT